MPRTNDSGCSICGSAENTLRSQNVNNSFDISSSFDGPPNELHDIKPTSTNEVYLNTLSYVFSSQYILVHILIGNIYIL